MSQPTELSAGALNGSDHLKVELIAPPGRPPFVAINWPTAATITTAASLDQGGGYRDAVIGCCERPAGSAQGPLAALAIDQTKAPRVFRLLGLCHSSASGERQR